MGLQGAVGMQDMYVVFVLWREVGKATRGGCQDLWMCCMLVNAVMLVEKNSASRARTHTHTHTPEFFGKPGAVGRKL